MSTYIHPRYHLIILTIYKEIILKIIQTLEIGVIIITEDYEGKSLIMISCPDEKIESLTQKLNENTQSTDIRKAD